MRRLLGIGAAETALDLRRVRPRVRRWGWGVKLCENDQRELELATVYIRGVDAAVKAGVPLLDACESIYEDTFYPDGVDARQAPTGEGGKGGGR